MSFESVLPSSHLILCRPLLLLPSIFPSITIFSNELALHIKWPKYWRFSFSFSISPSNEYLGWISFRMDWLDLLDPGIKGLSRVFSSTTIWKHQFLGAEPSWWPNSHIRTWPLRAVVWASMRSVGVPVLLVFLVSRTQVLKGMRAGGAGRRAGWMPWPWPSHKSRQGCRRGLPFHRPIVSLPEVLCCIFVKASLFSRCHLTNEVQECESGPSQFALLSYH